MCVEMTILLFAPRDGGGLLFALCLLNRFLSGASIAAASGADEAIAYDSLPVEGRQSAWDELLASAMRWRAVGFLIAMTLGGLLYDPSWLNAMLPEHLEIPVNLARRLPVALVLMQALTCLAISLRFEEKTVQGDHAAGRCAAAFRLTLRTAAKAFSTRTIAVVLTGGLLIDAVARNFATLASEYYRMIGIPGWAFGLIGSLVAVGNWFIPAIAAKLNQRFTPLGALSLGGVAALLGLLLLPPAWPWLGLLPAMLLMMLMGLVSFTVSRHLHEVAESSQRATLLSVKGLIFNLTYGLYSLMFSLALAGFGKHGDDAFQRVLGWQAGVFALALLAYIAVASRGGRMRQAG
jgi:MFS family permease